LIGLAIGSAWLLPRGQLRETAVATWRARWAMAGCMVLANCCDLDYVPGILSGDLNAYHHFYSHTPGWCLLVAAGVWCLLRFFRDANGRDFAWIFALLASHLAADLVTEDFRPPIGIMALWPFVSGFYISPVTVFLHLKKNTFGDFAQWHNVKAVLVEASWALPAWAGVVLMKSNAHRSAG
jgi:membrane-bound metal-dependent hydrolase YbcI (DUF457 family)